MIEMNTQPSSLSLHDSLHSEPESPKLSVVALRERKKDQTRSALARAAFDLFRDKGYEATTVAEIARAANVSRRTFFRYYSTKDALLFIENSDHLERFRELLHARQPGENNYQSIRRACLAISELFMRDRDQMVARFAIIGASPALSKQERQQDLLWERAIADALIADIDEPSQLAHRRARQLAGAVWGGVRATMLDWHGDQGRRDLVALANEGLALFEPLLRVEIEPSNPPRSLGGN